MEALCNFGKPSGWIIIRGSSLNGLSARIQSIPTPATISTKFVIPLNYSSFDFAAFLFHFVDKSQNISISLSSDEFINQSLPVGIIGQ
jgi:hypothetical protein